MRQIERQDSTGSTGLDTPRSSRSVDTRRDPSKGKKQGYDWTRYYAVIRRRQPKALIAIMGPDIRWVSNESGFAREGESSVRTRDGKPVWHPAECDVSIRPGWFYHEKEDAKVKSIEHLMDIYFKSVGRNSVLLLNVPPDRRGRFAEPDVNRLREFGAEFKPVTARYVRLNVLEATFAPTVWEFELFPPK